MEFCVCVCVYVSCCYVGTATCPPYDTRVVFTLLVCGGGVGVVGLSRSREFCVCVCVFLCCVGRHLYVHDRIPSTTPGAEPPRDAKDSGSARSHSMHLETSSSDRP